MLQDLRPCADIEVEDIAARFVVAAEFTQMFASSRVERFLLSARLMSESIICDRAFELACRVLKLAERMWDRGPAARHIATQMMRCGTSIGANAEEAEEAQTKPDFIAKQSISRKEAREARYWFRVAIRAEAVTADEVKWELSEVNQLLAMIVSSIRTARSSSYRGEDT